MRALQLLGGEVELFEERGVAVVESGALLEGHGLGELGVGHERGEVGAVVVTLTGLGGGFLGRRSGGFGIGGG